ncbi:uncharacterized protein C21orf58-like isoform X2 [Oncorhynchus mykiss]|uniref:uncharacterized protein C21orf58-like isoform X2 n=1 Tax=Oncorhynchus mykiss TaxID=8022 RepID=UPI0018786DCE|nr:uncharacterized protein C21orf58-like isoform X2 [Oncorhynchus mykiss]
MSTATGEREGQQGQQSRVCPIHQSFDGQADALHSVLRRKKDLLQRLREQHMLENLSRPYTWGGTGRRYRPDLLLTFCLLFRPPSISTSLPLHPQQMLPQQPTTFIQQLPQQQPLIQQMPPPQPNHAPQSGSIKDMVELMLMQNAQHDAESNVSHGPITT